MSSKRSTLAERRRSLVAASDENRAALGVSFAVVEHRLGVVDVVVATLRRLSRYREIVGIAGLGLVLAPRSTQKWIRRAVTLLPIAIEGYRLVNPRTRTRASS